MDYYPDNWTDKELEALEKRIAQVYRDAEKDLNKEVQEYFAKFKLRDKEMKALVDSGEMTEAEYQQWRITQIGRGQRFEALRDKVAERFTQANEVANAYVNDMTPSIYSLNRNYEAYTIEKAVGSCDFTMWDESTVRRLLVEEPDLMPYYPPSKALKRGIDLEYGKSQITTHVTSGIIRGLPPGKIANELMASITGMERANAVRAARTGITAAQNAGRMDSYVAAEKMGIQITRRWINTKDSKTRDSHQNVEDVKGTKEPFNVGGEMMMFPGDTSLGASGWNIYNCRCSMRTVEKDGIEAEPRETRVTNPLWEQAKAEEDKLTATVDRLKKREQAETDPKKKKEIRKERLNAQHELNAATKKRQGLDKNLVVPEMNYSEWKNWKNSLANPGGGGTMKVGKSAFTPAKTAKEAIDMLTAKCGFDAVESSFLAIDDELKIDNANQLAKLERKFNIIHRSKGTICSSHLANTMAYVSHRVTEPLNQNLSLCPVPFKDKKTLIAKEIAMRDRKFSMPFADEMASVFSVSHEYGHMLQNLLVQEAFKKDGWTEADPNAFLDRSKKTRNAIVKWYKKRADSVQKQCFEEIRDIAKANNPDFSMEDNISIYGKTDYAEFFAEVFANSQCGKPNELGNAMNIWLKKRGLIVNED